MAPHKRKRDHCKDSDDDYSPSVKKYEKVLPEAIKRPRRVLKRKTYDEESDSKLGDDSGDNSDSEPGSDSKLDNDSANSGDSDSETGSYLNLDDESSEDSDSESGSDSKSENESREDSDSESGNDPKLEGNNSDKSDSEPVSDSKLENDSSKKSNTEPGNDLKLNGDSSEDSDSEPESESKLEDDLSGDSESEPGNESKPEDDISENSESEPGNDSKLKGDSSEDSDSEPESESKLEDISGDSDSEPESESNVQDDRSDDSDSEPESDWKFEDDSIKDPDWVCENDESRQKKVKRKGCVKKKKKPKKRKTNTDALASNEKEKRHSAKKTGKKKKHDKKGEINACEMSNGKLSRNQTKEDNKFPSFSHFTPLSRNVHKKSHKEKGKRLSTMKHEKKKKLKKVAQTDASVMSNQEQSDSETRNVLKENHVEKGERHSKRKAEKKKEMAHTGAFEMSNEEQLDSQTRNVPKENRGEKRKRHSKKKMEKNKKTKIDACEMEKPLPNRSHDKKHKVSSKAASSSYTIVASPCEVESQTSTRSGRKGSKSKLYLCRKCNILFEMKSKYRTHKRSCQSQSVGGGDKLDDNDNQDNEEEQCNDASKIYLCRKCNISFKVKSKYKMHKWNCQSESAGGDKLDDNDNQDNEEDHQDYEEDQRNDAVSQEQNEILECGTCGDLFQDSLDILLHQRKHTKVKCKGCKESFPDEATLQLHIRLLECPKQYKNDKKKNATGAKGGGYFECRFCNHAFGSIEKRSLHMSGHFTQQSALSGVGSAVYKQVISARNALKAADEHKTNTVNSGIADERESTDFQKLNNEKDAESDKSDALVITEVQDDQNSKGINGADTRSHPPSSTSCDKCNVEFSSADTLKEHQKLLFLVDPKYPYVCTICPNKDTNNLTLLESECQFLQHQKQFKFVCPLCKMHFRQNKVLRTHIRSCHDYRGRKTCPGCHQMFGSEEYSRHMEYNSNQIEYFDHKCLMCGLVFSTVKALLEHDVHYRFHCNVCKHHFATFEHLENHRKNLHNLDTKSGPKLHLKFECKHCGFRFKRGPELSLHVKTVLESEASESLLCSWEHKHFTCLRCGMTFVDYAEFQVHKQIWQYECHKCKAHFQQRIQLSSHIEMNHFKCKYCNSDFNTNDARRQHEDKAERAKAQMPDNSFPFTCADCDEVIDYVCLDEVHWKRHKRSKLNPVSCWNCRCEFSCRTGFNNHLKAMPVEEQCSWCDVKLSTVCQKEMHFTMHSKEKMECVHCGAQFKSMDDKAKHLRSFENSSGRKARCSVCNKGISKCQIAEHRKHVEDKLNGQQCAYCLEIISISPRNDGSQHQKLADNYAYLCGCGEMIRSDCQRQKHKATHPFTCMKCHSHYVTVADLVQHLLKYNVANVVNEAGMGNKEKLTLKKVPTWRRTGKYKKHLTVWRKRMQKYHARYRQYFCLYCKEQFCTTEEMKEHKSALKYECPQCKKHFRSPLTALYHFTQVEHDSVPDKDDSKPNHFELSFLTKTKAGPNDDILQVYLQQSVCNMFSQYFQLEQQVSDKSAGAMMLQVGFTEYSILSSEKADYSQPSRKEGSNVSGEVSDEDPPPIGSGELIIDLDRVDQPSHKEVPNASGEVADKDHPSIGSGELIIDLDRVASPASDAQDQQTNKDPPSIRSGELIRDLDGVTSPASEAQDQKSSQTRNIEKAGARPKQKQKRYPCKYCRRVYDTESHLQQHIARMSSIRKGLIYTCNVCDSIFDMMCQVENHVAHICPRCGEHLPSAEIAARHQVNCNDKTIVSSGVREQRCAVCTEIIDRYKKSATGFVKNRLMDMKCFQIDGLLKWVTCICLYCKEELPSKCHVNGHLQAHPYRCLKVKTSSCGRHFHQQKQLRLHVCNKCPMPQCKDLYFGSMKTVDVHKRNWHRLMFRKFKLPTFPERDADGESEYDRLGQDIQNTTNVNEKLTKLPTRQERTVHDESDDDSIQPARQNATDVNEDSTSIGFCISYEYAVPPIDSSVAVKLSMLEAELADASGSADDIPRTDEHYTTDMIQNTSSHCIDHDYAAYPLAGVDSHATENAGDVPQRAKRPALSKVLSKVRQVIKKNKKAVAKASSTGGIRRGMETTTVKPKRVSQEKPQRGSQEKPQRVSQESSWMMAKKKTSSSYNVSFSKSNSRRLPGSTLKVVTPSADGGTVRTVNTRKSNSVITFRAPGSTLNAVTASVDSRQMQSPKGVKLMTISNYQGAKTTGIVVVPPHSEGGSVSNLAGVSTEGGNSMATLRGVNTNGKSLLGGTACIMVPTSKPGVMKLVPTTSKPIPMVMNPVPATSESAAMNPVPATSEPAAMNPVPVSIVKAAINPVPTTSEPVVINPVPVSIKKVAINPVPVSIEKSVMNPVPATSKPGMMKLVPTRSKPGAMYQPVMKLIPATYKPTMMRLAPAATSKPGMMKLVPATSNIVPTQTLNPAAAAAQRMNIPSDVSKKPGSKYLFKPTRNVVVPKSGQRVLTVVSNKVNKSGRVIMTNPQELTSKPTRYVVDLKQRLQSVVSNEVNLPLPKVTTTSIPPAIKAIDVIQNKNKNSTPATSDTFQVVPFGLQGLMKIMFAANNVKVQTEHVMGERSTKHYLECVFINEDMYLKFNHPSDHKGTITQVKDNIPVELFGIHVGDPKKQQNYVVTISPCYQDNGDRVKTIDGFEDAATVVRVGQCTRLRFLRQRTNINGKYMYDIVAHL